MGTQGPESHVHDNTTYAHPPDRRRVEAFLQTLVYQECGMFFDERRSTSCVTACSALKGLPNRVFLGYLPPPDQP